MNISDNRIKLKPINNIKPEIYIPVIYLSILIIIVFSITLLPGILRNGSNISITSSPMGSEVFCDGVRVGATPLTFYADGGVHELTIKKDNFTSITKEITIKSKYLFSLFRRKNLNYHFNLKSGNGENILNESYKDAAMWSLVNVSDISSRYQIPPLFSSAVSSYLYSNDYSSNELNRYLESSLKLITNESLLADYIKALLISESENRMPSISTIANTALFIQKILEERENIPLLFYNRLLRSPEIEMNNDLYQDLNDRHRKIINRNVTAFDDPENNIIIDDLTFVNIPESTTIPVDVNFFHNVEQDEFYILKSMVTRVAYDLFTMENPEWSILNKRNLMESGLVDKNYMNFLYDEKYITNISYYAAEAWCRWANEYYDLPEGWRISLPTENMWFSALEYGVLEDIEAWQWTNSGFFLYDHFLTDRDGTPIESYTEITPRLVVGRNKYNSKSESGRGIQNAEWCTPFISFRPVLIKE